MLVIKRKGDTSACFASNTLDFKPLDKCPNLCFKSILIPTKRFL